MTKKHLNELTYEIIGAAIEVHSALGPGLLESVYDSCLNHELGLRSIKHKSQTNIPIFFKEKKMNVDLRCDYIIEDCMVVEIKSVASILPIHEAQLLTYMKLLQLPKGMLINFNSVNIFREGQKTFVNELFRSLPEE